MGSFFPVSALSYAQGVLFTLTTTPEAVLNAITNRLNLVTGQVQCSLCFIQLALLVLVPAHLLLTPLPVARV
jgi:hypothetical protein